MKKDVSVLCFLRANAELADLVADLRVIEAVFLEKCVSCLLYCKEIKIEVRFFPLNNPHRI